MGALAQAADTWNAHNGTIGGLYHLKVVPGSRQQVIEAFGPVLQAVEKEEGTLLYLLFVDENDADSIWIYGRYRDKAAAEAHAATEVARSFMNAISAYVIETRQEDLALLAAKGIAKHISGAGEGS